MSSDGMTTVRVVSSPFHEDEDLPWEYEEDGFVSWVYDVFLEGYKRDIAFPSLDEAIQTVEHLGYKVRRI